MTDKIPLRSQRRDNENLKSFVKIRLKKQTPFFNLSMKKFNPNRTVRHENGKFSLEFQELLY